MVRGFTAMVWKGKEVGEHLWGKSDRFFLLIAKAVERKIQPLSLPWIKIMTTAINCVEITFLNG